MSIACFAACALTALEFAETGPIYAALVAWCVSTFCEDR